MESGESRVESVESIIESRELRDMEKITKNRTEPVAAEESGGIAELMSSNDKSQRRAVGNILKFLAFALVVTLIARGTYGATLARVETAVPSRATITDDITGSAVVTSRDTLETYAPEGLTIIEMMVNTGQLIKSGDALAKFDDEEVREKLEREKASLDKLLLELEKLERSEPADVSSLEAAQRNLQRAQEDYTITAAAESDSVRAAQNDLDEVLGKIADDPDGSALGNALRNLQRARDDYNSTMAQGEADVAEAFVALATARESQSGYVDHSVVESAQRSLQRAQQDYNTVIAQGEADTAAAWAELYALEMAQNNWWDTGDGSEAGAEAGEAEITRAREALVSAQKRAEENLLAAGRRVEDAVTSLDKAEQDYSRALQQSAEAKQSEIDRAQSALESAQSREEENLLSASRRIEDAQTALAKAEDDYDNSTQQASDSRLSEIDRARSALESAQKKAEENLANARRRIEDAEVSLRKAEQDQNKSAQQTDDSAAQNSVSAISIRLDINSQKSVVEALERLLANGCLIYSDMDGVVYSAAPEGGITGKAALVIFRDGTKGFEARLQIKKTEAERLAVGDECEVTTGGGSIYYNPTVTGTISGVSLPDETDMATVTIRLPGSDWTEGQRVEAQVLLSSGNYDFCVPLSALHSDNTGYYLLAVEQHSTVLGLQNTVTRVNVSIEASDSDTVSVRGPVDRNSRIITGSSKQVSAGDSVRMS